MNLEGKLIPKIWKELEDNGPPHINIWNNRLRTSKYTCDMRPKTIMGVSYMKVINLVPQDAGHPLYCPKYSDLTDEFLLDHLSMDAINLSDATLGNEGITLKMMSGKTILFKTENGGCRANGIKIESTNCLSDGTQVVILEDFLFNHFDDVQTAFQGMKHVPFTG